jgi:hypothetical protein
MREGEHYTFEGVQEKVRRADAELQESLVAERGVLPEDFFRLAHDVNGLVYQSTVVRKAWEELDYEGEATQLYERIDERYLAMVEYVRAYFGIERGPG